MNLPRLILTRPAGQALGWQQGLQALGYEVHSLPLIEIAAADSAADQQALHAAWQGLDQQQALMFVSSNAVQYFLMPKRPITPVDTALTATYLIANEQHLRFWATGPGTVQALLDAGLPRSRIDAPSADASQLDSEALWQLVQPQIQAGSRVLLLRGRDVGTPDTSRDWLAQQVQSAGGQADSLVVYERRAPQLSAPLLQQAQAWLGDGSVWLFSSSQALAHLPASLDVRAGRCIATHERIAAAARARGFAVVCKSRPILADVAVSIKSLHE
jgi:uroporphyrinogen-III synthase